MPRGKKPMPTTHFHVVPVLLFLLFVCCLSEEIHYMWVEPRERVTAFLSVHYLRSCGVCFFFPLLANSSKSKALYNLKREEERKTVTCVA